MSKEPHSKQYEKLGKDTLIFAISNFSTKILVFLMLPLYTSCLSTEQYGIVDLINNIVLILFPILTFSVIEGILRFSYDKDVKQSEILTISVFSIIIALVILGIATPIAYFIGKDVWKYWGWLFIVFGGYSLTTTVSYYLRGINRASYVAFQGVLQTFLVVSANVILLVFFKMGLQGYLLALVISYYTTSIITIFFSGIYKDFVTLKINTTLLKSMMKYCIPMIPSKVAWWMNNSLDKYYIIFFRDISVSGLYSVAHKIPSILSVFTEIFNQAWQISAIEIFTDNNDCKANDMYSIIHKYYLYFVVVCSSVIILFSELLGKILFAKEFFVAWKFVPLLIIAAVFSSLSGFYHSIFRAAKMSKELSITVIAGTIVNVVLNTGLVPFFGAFGAAIATVIGFTFEWIISFKYAQRVVSLSIDYMKTILAFVLIIIECCVTTYTVNEISYCIIDVFLIICLVFLLRKEMMEIVSKLLVFIKQKKKVEKNNNG